MTWLGPTLSYPINGLALNQLLEIFSLISARYLHYHVQAFVDESGSEFAFYF